MYPIGRPVVGNLGRGCRPCHKALQFQCLGAFPPLQGVSQMDRMDTRATQRVSGPSWKEMRPTFEAVSEKLLSVCPTATGELTTIYVKYASQLETKGQPYAVVWLIKRVGDGDRTGPPGTDLFSKAHGCTTRV